MTNNGWLQKHPTNKQRRIPSLWYNHNRRTRVHIPLRIGQKNHKVDFLKMMKQEAAATNKPLWPLKIKIKIYTKYHNYAHFSWTTNDFHPQNSCWSIFGGAEQSHPQTENKSFEKELISIFFLYGNVLFKVNTILTPIYLSMLSYKMAFSEQKSSYKRRKQQNKLAETLQNFWHRGTPKKSKQKNTKRKTHPKNKHKYNAESYNTKQQESDLTIQQYHQVLAIINWWQEKYARCCEKSWNGSQQQCQSQSRNVFSKTNRVPERRWIYRCKSTFRRSVSRYALKYELVGNPKDDFPGNDDAGDFICIKSIITKWHSMTNLQSHHFSSFHNMIFGKFGYRLLWCIKNNTKKVRYIFMSYLYRFEIRNSRFCFRQQQNERRRRKWINWHPFCSWRMEHYKKSNIGASCWFGNNAFWQQRKFGVLCTRLSHVRPISSTKYWVRPCMGRVTCPKGRPQSRDTNAVEQNQRASQRQNATNTGVGSVGIALRSNRWRGSRWSLLKQNRDALRQRLLGKTPHWTSKKRKMEHKAFGWT